MTNQTKTRRRFTAQQRQEAVALCLSGGLSCTAVAQWLAVLWLMPRRVAAAHCACFYEAHSTAACATAQDTMTDSPSTSY
jgi:DNA-binding transcriptional regulator YdaS (Cro superfamily)